MSAAKPSARNFLGASFVFFILHKESKENGEGVVFHFPGFPQMKAVSAPLFVLADLFVHQ